MPPINDAAKWRSADYLQIPYLWIDNPPIIFQCQVNGAVTFPIADIPYDNVTVGTYTDCWQHESVVFSSTQITYAGDADLGRGRLRLTPDGSKVYIGRSSQGTADGTCNIADDSWISVIDQFRPYARIPFIADGIVTVNGVIPPATTQFRDFNLTYNVGINGSPQVNLGYGPGFGSNVDPNTDLLTVTFNSVGLFSKGYDSNIVSWAVNYGDGTIISGSIPNITLTFPVGRRHVHFTATDGNGNTQTRHILIVACKDGTAYEAIKEFDVSGRDLSLNGNQNTFSVRVRQSIPRSTYPDNMNVIFWKEEYYNGVKGSINVIGSNGQTGCESVKFSGWHYTDENDTAAQSTGFINEVTLHCLDIGGWLDQLPGFPIEINRMASPTSWYQQKNANIDKYIAEAILEYLSTARFITDFYDSNTGDMYGISRLGSGQQTLYASCQEFMDRAIAYEFAVNEQGMIFCRPNQNLIEPINRTSVNIVTLTEDDIVSFKFLYQRFPRQHWNRGAYVVASTVDITSITTPQVSFWVAPGQAPGQGSQAVDYNEQLIVAPTEGQIRTALRYAEDNSDYGDFEITLTWPGDAGIDPAYGQWITINISSQFAAQRGIPFTNARFRVMKISYAEQANPTGNVTTVKVTGRVETSGLAAVDDTPPVSNVTPPPPVAPPPPPLDTNFNSGVTAIALDGNLSFRLTGNKGQHWSAKSYSGYSGGGPFYSVLDPQSPYLTTGSGSLNIYMVNSLGLWYGTDILNSGVFVLKFSFGCIGGMVRPDTTTLSGGVVSFYNQNHPSIDRVDLYRFSGHGASTTWHVLIDRTGSSSVPSFVTANGFFDINQNGIDEVLITLWTSVTGGDSVNLWRILNGGTPVKINDGLGSGALHPGTVQRPLLTPLNVANLSVSGSEYIIWTNNGQILKTTNGGATRTNISPPINLADFGSQNVFVPTDNGNVIIVASPSGFAGNYNLAYSNNGGLSYNISVSHANNVFATNIVKIANGVYKVYIIGSNDLTAMSTRDLSTWEDWVGDWGANGGGWYYFIPLG